MPPVRGQPQEPSGQPGPRRATSSKSKYSLRMYKGSEFGAPFEELYKLNYEAEFAYPFNGITPGDPRPSPLALSDLTYSRTLGEGKDKIYLARVNRNKKHELNFPFDIVLKAKRRGEYRSEALHFLPEEEGGEASVPRGRKALLRSHFTNLNGEQISLVNMPWSPWVAGLIQTFHDPQQIYMGLEYIPGGTLRSLLKKSPGGLKVSAARFYYTNIVLALEFLESCLVVHRDLTPDNILIGEDGYLVLTDFGDSLSAANKKAEWTEGGSNYYRAPEYSPDYNHHPWFRPFALDWWSSGVILYEMVSGKLPYVGATSEETLELTLSAGEFKWPDGFRVGNDLNDLVGGLLVRSPSRRAGATVREVQAHDWFSPVDWEKMALRRYLPPFPLINIIPQEDRWMSLPPPKPTHTPHLKIPEEHVHLRHDGRFLDQPVEDVD